MTEVMMNLSAGDIFFICLEGIGAVFLVSALVLLFGNDKFVQQWFPAICLSILAMTFARLGIPMWIIAILVTVGAVIMWRILKRAHGE